MKNRKRIVIILCAALILSACGQQSTFSQATAPIEQGMLSVSEERELYLAGLTINSAPVADLTDLNAVSSVYVKPLVATGGIFSYSWMDAFEIKADDLLNVLCYNNFLSLPQDNEGVYLPSSDTPPAEQVESALQKHFNVTSDHLRASDRYDAASETYQMIGGFGGGGGAVAMGAKQNGNQITIRIALMQYKSDMIEVTKSAIPDGRLDMTDEMILTPKGTLKLELSDRTTVKYISYQLDDGVTW